MEIEIDEFHALQKQISDLRDCCFEWGKQALDYKAENIALSGKLELTHKALDIAVDALDTIDRFLDGVIGINHSEMRAIVKSRLDQIKQITALEQKGE